MNGPHGAVEPAGRRSRGILWALALLTLGTLLARQVGLGALAPSLTEPDDNLVYQARVLEQPGASPERAWQWPSYPLLLAHAVALLPRPSAEPRPEEDLEQWLARAAAESKRARRVVSVLGAASVPLCYALARSFCGPLFALGAAGMAATSLLLTSFGQQARPHAPLVSAVAAALVAALAQLERPSRARLAALGVALAAAVGTLQSGLALLPPASWVAWRTGRGAGRWAGVAWVAACAAASLALLHPALLQGGAEGGGLRWIGTGLRQGEHQVMGEQLSLGGAGMVLRGFWNQEGAAALLALAGALGLALARRRGWRASPAARSRAGLLAVFALPYLALLCCFSDTQPRFLMPLLPCAYVLGAGGLERGFGAGRVRAGALLALLSAVVFSGWISATLLAARARPSTLEQAAHWLEQHARPSERVFASPGLDLPLFSTQAALQGRLAWIGPGYHSITGWSRYQQGQAAALERLERLGGAVRWEFGWLNPRRFLPNTKEEAAVVLAELAPCWLVLDVSERPLRKVGPGGEERAVGAQAWIDPVAAAAGELGTSCARLAPSAVHDLPALFEDHGHPRHWHALGTLRHNRAFGPVLAIYRLDRPGGEQLGRERGGPQPR
jgi:4-amino-4-deoxy-L-arabinose transferase-like glycosyltransferase